MKKLGILFATVIMIMLFAVSASAKEVVDSGECGAQGDNVTWVLYDDGELVLSGNGNTKNYDSFFGSPFEGKLVDTITINEGVTSIGEDLLSGIQVKRINLPSTLSTIYDKLISQHSLEVIFVSENNPNFSSDENGVLFNNDKSVLINYPLGNSRKTYNIPDGVKIISSQAFLNNKNLITVSFPVSLRKIEPDAFYLSNLKYVFYEGTNKEYGNINISENSLSGSVDVRCSTLVFNDFIYEYLDDGTIEIIKYIGFDDEIVIPEEVDGAKITSISGLSGYYNNENIVEVHLSKNINSMNGFFCSLSSQYVNGVYVDELNQTFSSDEKGVLYNKDKSVLLFYPDYSENDRYSVHENTEYIEDDAFHNSKKIEEITLSKNIKDFGWSVVEACNNLKYINVDNENVNLCSVDGIVYSKDKKVLLYCPDNYLITENVNALPGTVEIANQAFANCKNIKTISLPEGLTTIGQYSFMNCKKLEEIYFPDSVSNIDSVSSFLSTPWFDNLPTGIVYIGKVVLTYKNSESMPENTKIIIKEGVEKILCRAFSECVNLSEIILPESLKEIEAYAFSGCSSLKNITIPKNVSIFGDNAFSGCPITKVEYKGTLDDWLKIDAHFGGNWYSHSSPLQSGADFYINNELVTELNIPANINEIRPYAFSGCTSIKKLVIENGVEEIGPDAFSSCEYLEEVHIPKSIKLIHRGAFVAPIQRVYYGGSIESWLKIVFGYGGEMLGSHSNPLNCGADLYINDKIVEKVVIPSGTTEIKPCAFDGCRSITSLIIPDSVTIIGGEAFQMCQNLKSVSIGKSIKTIERSAFFYCKELNKIEIYGNVEEIGDRALGYYLDNIDIGYSLIENYTIYGVPGSASETYAMENGITFIPIEEHIHTYTSTITTEPTCTTAGTKTYTCSCGDTYAESIPAINHANATTDEGKAPTETEVGYTAGKYCPDCKTWIEGHEEIPMLHVHSYTPTITREPTCVILGLTTYTCSCGDSYTETMPVLSHEYYYKLEKSTLTKGGALHRICKNCNGTKNVEIYPLVNGFILSDYEYTYNGKVKTPTVTVKDETGLILVENKDYTVKYESGRKNPGKYTVTVTLIGNYEGEKKLEFSILPGKTSKITATQSTSSIKLTWKKVTGADGYRVYQYNSKTGKYEKIKTLTGTSYTVKKLKAGTTYKFAVKAYSKADGETLWAASSVSIKTATKPATPTVKATAGSKQATISWNKVTGATGYVIYMQDEFGDYEKLGSTKKTSYTRKKLTKGETYYFRVRAYKTVDGKNIYGGYKTVKVKVK